MKKAQAERVIAQGLDSASSFPIAMLPSSSSLHSPRVISLSRNATIAHNKPGMVSLVSCLRCQVDGLDRAVPDVLRETVRLRIPLKNQFSD